MIRRLGKERKAERERIGAILCALGVTTVCCSPAVPATADGIVGSGLTSSSEQTSLSSSEAREREDELQVASGPLVDPISGGVSADVPEAAVQAELETMDAGENVAGRAQVARRFWVVPGSVQLEASEDSVAATLQRRLNAHFDQLLDCRAPYGERPSPGASFEVLLDDAGSATVEAEVLPPDSAEEEALDAETLACILRSLRTLPWSEIAQGSTRIRFSYHYR